MNLCSTTHRRTHPISTRTTPAFTLVELLIVVAIIGLLLSIIVPAIGEARHSAKTTTCATNLNHVGKQLNFYLNDWRETYPGTFDPGLDNNGTPRIVDLMGDSHTVSFASYSEKEDRPLYEYLNATDVAHCPLDAGDFAFGGDATAFEKFGNSYIYRNRTRSEIENGVRRIIDGTWAIEGHRQLEIERPFKKLILADLPIDSGRSASDDRHQWHNEDDPLRVNILFADGHVTEENRKLQADLPSGAAIGWPVDVNQSGIDQKIRALANSAYY